MPKHGTQNQDAVVWPPAVLLPNVIQPDPVLVKAARTGKYSLWASGAGVGCWLFTWIGVMILAFVSKIILNADAPIHTAYFTGLACEIFGLWLGVLSRKAKAGKIGAALSIGVLCLMVVLTIVNHQANGNVGWIWNANEGDDLNCGCDNSG
ncbi:MAG: hypothetical protein ACRYFS_01110 [Janthinobacterium lividum]